MAEVSIGVNGIDLLVELGINQMDLDDYFQLVEAHILLKNHFAKDCDTEKEANSCANILLSYVLNDCEPMSEIELAKGSCYVDGLMKNGVPQ